ncbi:hypothetical protein KFK09_029160 [Dendrobium nobile]|uniref:Tify domain-containing protein n=1 Tax=Dendrobium nobile TaxID=94219 RepID=A0A8T3A4G5_DENNO|nr:hypothetical protein KFK09_029160 [Dendrobium nobile]
MQEYVLRSGVRSGLMREFAFALKSQAKLSKSLCRTRSRKGSVEAPASPPPPSCWRKIPKLSDDQEKQSVIIHVPPVGSVILALQAEGPIDVDFSLSGGVAVDIPTTDTRNNGNPMGGVGVSISAYSKEELEKDNSSSNVPVISEGVGGGEKDNLLVEKSNTNHGKSQEDVIEIPIVVDNCGGLDFETGKLEESIKGEQEGSVSVAILLEFDVDNGTNDGAPLEKPIVTPTRRFIRTLVTTVANGSTLNSVVFVESEDSKGDNDAINESLRATSKKKMELKISKKITLTKFPSNARDLLGIGLLKGLPVKYISCPSKVCFIVQNVGLQGIITGNGVLCSCASCQGKRIHAGCTKKHPSYFIFLQNGKSLREVLKSCTGASLDILEAAIQNAIGPLPPMKLSLCQNCKVLLPKQVTYKPLADLLFKQSGPSFEIPHKEPVFEPPLRTLERAMVPRGGIAGARAGAAREHRRSAGASPERERELRGGSRSRGSGGGWLAERCINFFFKFDRRFKTAGKPPDKIVAGKNRRNSFSYAVFTGGNLTAGKQQNRLKRFNYRRKWVIFL